MQLGLILLNLYDYFLFCMLSIKKIGFFPPLLGTSHRLVELRDLLSTQPTNLSVSQVFLTMFLLMIFIKIFLCAHLSLLSQISSNIFALHHDKIQVLIVDFIALAICCAKADITEFRHAPLCQSCRVAISII